MKYDLLSKHSLFHNLTRNVNGSDTPSPIHKGNFNAKGELSRRLPKGSRTVTEGDQDCCTAPCAT